jgi:hypothetical protein
VGDGGDAGLEYEVGCAGEASAGHFGEDAYGPGVDSGHRGQGPLKTAGLHQNFDPGRDVVALVLEGEHISQEFAGRVCHPADGPKCRAPQPGSAVEMTMTPVTTQ